MKTTIRFILVSFLFCMYAKNAHAQMDTLFTDTVLIEIPFQHMVDSCFEHVDLDLVPTGLLLEHGYPTIDVKTFDGNLNDSNYAHTYSWRKAYGTLLRSFIDSTAAFDTLGKKVADMQQYLDSGYVPIGIINYQYDRIKETAIADSLIYANGIQLFDVNGRTEIPYETARCFIAAAAVNEVNHSVVQFVLNESFYISNDTRTIDHYEIDFADGNGFVNAALNDTIEITYDTAMALTLTLKAVFTDESQEQSDFALSTEQATVQAIALSLYHTTPDDGDIVTADELYTGTSTYGKVKYSIRYGCGNQQEKKLRKPFFIVLGLSVPGKNSPDVSDGRQLLDGFFNANQAFYLALYYQGYDIIFVDYVDATIEIQNNAYALEKLIRQVNEIKASNGSTHPNSYLGFSMGGLVGRYALAHMKTLEAANPGNTDYEHDTKLFIAHDAPLLGANQPMGLQALKMHAYKTIFEDHKLVIDPREFEDIYWDYLDLLCPAARQMLIYQYNYTGSLYGSFYTEMNALNSGNIGCKAVAISNGRGRG